MKKIDDLNKYQKGRLNLSLQMRKDKIWIYFGSKSKGLQNIIQLDQILFGDFGILNIELLETHELQILLGAFLTAWLVRALVIALDAFSQSVLKVLFLHIHQKLWDFWSRFGWHWVVGFGFEGKGKMNEENLSFIYFSFYLCLNF